MTKIGTLAEIGAKPGDVVEAQDGDYPKYVVGKNYRGNRIGTDDSVKLKMNLLYRIVSRAPEKRDTNIGTLSELNAKPGDIVEFVPTGNHHTVLCCKRLADTNGAPINYDISWDCVKTFRIVSRAEETPKLWRDMTPEEKGALLLAHHEGKVIEWTGNFGSEFDMDSTRGTPVWSDTHAYRIKPEPKVETVHLMNFHELAKGHAIVFTVKDGEPDCTSIKMEKL